jgi:cytidylate kinase
MPRTVGAMVDHQARRWLLDRSERPEAGRRPVLTVSRQHGAGGNELVRRLADELGLDVFDREILHQIAESTHLSERVVTTLDEKSRELLTDWLAGMASRNYLSPVEYRYQLSHVVGAIAHHGGAIIIGRGAHLILGQGEALRVHVVAPIEARVARLMQREGLAERDARRQIQVVDSDRKAFLMKHFHIDHDDPTHFDLVVNTALLGVERACTAVRSAYEQLESAAGAARAPRA